MAKVKTSFFCQSCGAQSSKWLGKCPSCGAWNTYVEEVVYKEDDWKKGVKGGSSKTSIPKPLFEVEYAETQRYITPDQEVNRVLGGGIVPGSVVLMGGEPGIGKSTLMLQLALLLKDIKVLYVSGEESREQIKMRADRLKITSENCFILTETGTQNIFKQVELLQPNIVIIDSIQTLHSAHIDSAAGTVSQVRECAAEFIKFAKETQTPVFLIGHITKEGALAGPKVLEHMVDTVLQFEGDRQHVYRVLRTTKNRFGSTSELGVYEMSTLGLKVVTNPSAILLSHRESDLSGVAVGAMIEGSRPFLVEVQSLVSASMYGTPQRSSTGFDHKRLHMLLAVIEKRAGLRVGAQDVFLNITGGLKIEDPALDLAVCVSLVSSMEDISISPLVCFAGEIGLGGEVRAVNRIESRISEAEKLGFEEIYISNYNLKGLDKGKFNITIHSVSKLTEVFEQLFG